MQKVSQRICQEIMREILVRQNAGHLLDRSSNEEFFQRLTKNEETSDALDFLEAKGFISCSNNPVSHRLLQIHVNEPGITYFEDFSERVHEKHVENIRVTIQ